jgi:hypothetical protein
MRALDGESIAVKRIRDLAETLTKMDEDGRRCACSASPWPSPPS